jgi:hypothetical protein
LLILSASPPFSPSLILLRAGVVVEYL